jgi:predicted molibdopterin-dependent oxidoreductase YjgC
MGATPGENGLGIIDMIPAMSRGDIKAALVMADGVSGYAPALEGLPIALGNLDFLVVSAVFDSEITAQADVVLPAATYAEQSSTVTNVERRVQLLRVTAEPRHEELTGWETIARIARAMGSTDFAHGSSSDVFAEIAGNISNYRELSHEVLQSGGIQWPVDSSSVVGTPLLYADSTQKVTVVQLSYDELAESIGTSALTFAPGRVLSQPERDVKVRKLGEMNYIDREQLVQIHPDDAKATGLREGDLIRVKTEDGHVLARGTAVYESPQPGLVGSTTLFGELATRMHELEVPDWAPLMPGLGFARVTLETAPVEQEAGAAAD